MNESYHFEIDFLENVFRQNEEDLPVLEMLAGFYTKAGRIDEGLTIDEKIVQIDPKNPVHHYNLACSLALKSRVNDSVDAIRTALERGYSDFKWMLKDPDLANLHSNANFAALLAEYQIKNQSKS